MNFNEEYVNIILSTISVLLYLQLLFLEYYPKLVTPHSQPFIYF